MGWIPHPFERVARQSKPAKTGFTAELADHAPVLGRRSAPAVEAQVMAGLRHNIRSALERALAYFGLWPDDPRPSPHGATASGLPPSSG